MQRKLRKNHLTKRIPALKIILGVWTPIKAIVLGNLWQKFLKAYLLSLLLSLALCIYFINVLLNVLFLSLGFIIVLYKLLYNWRQVKKSLSFFIFFFCNSGILLSFCTSSLVVLQGIPKLIYWEDIAQTFLFRSMIYSCIMLVSISIFIVIYVFNINVTKYNNHIVPYLYNESYKLFCPPQINWVTINECNVLFLYYIVKTTHWKSLWQFLIFFLYYDSNSNALFYR